MGVKSSALVSENVENDPVNLTVRQRRGVAALLVCSTHEQAAQALGLSPRTLLRWRKQKAFKEALRRAYLDAVENAVGAAQFMSDEAVETLRQIHRDPSQPAGARIAAARYLDQRHWQLVRFGELLREVEQIKGILDGRDEVSDYGF
jgi:hypothetical protein